jgi:pyruvate dehydrogenase E1 component alpha subunit
VWEAFAGFLAAARAGGGPFLLECLTQRLRGHYEGDPVRYREAILAEEWQRLDPIRRLERAGAAAGWLSPRERDACEREATEAVEAAVEFARASPYPEPGEIAALVYAS